MRQRFVFVLVIFMLTGPWTWAQKTPGKDPIASAELGDAGPFHPVGFTNGIGFHNSDNTFSSNLRFRIQNRADFFYNEGIDDQASDFSKTWQVRRARLRFNGHVVNPKLRYLLQLSFSRADQDWDESGVPNVIRDAMILYDVTDNWQVGFGQGKLPGNRQRVVSSGDLQFVDRSTVNAEFNIDRDFGFQTQYTLPLGEQILALKGSITSGEGRNRNVRNENDGNYVARLEYLPLGRFDRNGDYFESDLVFEEKPKLSIGYTYAVLTGAARKNGTVGEIFTVTGDEGDKLERRTQSVQFLDAIFKYRGYSLLAELARRDAERPLINPDQAVLVGYGLNVQAGKMLNQTNEIAARYAIVAPEGDSLLVHNRVQDYALVFNYFVNGHRVKLQAEGGYQEARQAYVRLQMELGI